MCLSQPIYPLWFKCHAQDLPGIWLTKYPGWGNHNSGFSVFNSCKKAVGSLTGAYKCSAFIEEKCLISPVVAAKTTRMVHSQNVKRFAQIETDIHVLHAFRDPRAQLSSRAQLELVYKKNQLSHLITSCWN
ncbi:hypothetical protein EB796_006253 [Bugula neritina]|uniref:Uncharacterized protein n=1 Tax=Bugula neritina TaxID=10212 RepID=A0A7J7KB58_BUGNE|nr:hypothetical protein EB796_006253 [Bugula neritina]